MINDLKEIWNQLIEKKKLKDTQYHNEWIDTVLYTPFTNPYNLALSDDEGKLFCCTIYGHILIWDMLDLKKSPQVIQHHHSKIDQLIICKLSTKIFSSSQNAIAISNFKDQKPVELLVHPHNILQFALIHQEGCLVIALESRKIYIRKLDHLHQEPMIID